MPEHGEDAMRIPDRRPTALTRAERPGGDGAARPLAGAGLAGTGKTRSGADRGGRESAIRIASP